MATWHELLQNYVNLSYADLVAIGRKQWVALAPSLRARCSDGDVFNVIVWGILGSTVAVDQKVSSLECSFINDVLGTNLTMQGLLNVATQFNTPAARTTTDNLIDSISDAEKTALCTLCLCLLAVDQTITREEVAFIQRLVG